MQDSVSVKPILRMAWHFSLYVKRSRKKQQANSKKTPSKHHNLFMQQTTRRWSFSRSSWPAADPCSALRDSLALQQGTWKRTWVDQDPTPWFWLPTSRKGKKQWWTWWTWWTQISRNTEFLSMKSHQIWCLMISFYQLVYSSTFSMQALSHASKTSTNSWAFLAAPRCLWASKLFEVVGRTSKM